MLVEKLKKKQAVIGIIGLGYVGLPLALRYAEVGFKVVGFDVDQTKIDNIYAKKTYIKHISSDSIESGVAAGMEATVDFSRISEVDAIIICVPTPLNKYREPDLSYVTNTVDAALPFIKAGQIMSLESTTYPGTTDEEIVPRVESKGFKVGENFSVVFSPEREDPGNPSYTTATIPKVVGGYTPQCLEAGVALYDQVVTKVVPVSSTRAAEMTKLLENIHRAVNIGLVNEMKIVADKMKIDIYEVIDAAATKPFGFTAFYPGPGLGGHCIPIDPFYLTWKAREYGVHTRFIELAGEINTSMIEWVIGKITLGLNKQSKSINQSKVLVVGIAYKKNVDDMRESPSVEIMEELMHLGAEVSYHDDFVPKFPHMRKHYFEMSTVALTKENLAQFDCVVVATDHDYIDYSFLLENSKLLVDCRGRFRKENDRVVRA